MARTVVKISALTALAIISLGITPTLAFTIPLNPGALPYNSADVLQAAKKKSEKKPNKGHNYSAAKDYIPGRVLTPYGYKDCIGWWERHSNGRMQCHGQMIGNY